ncbi:hypothetical protein [Azospirillum sp. BE72]|uniref:hypothetical protein n=1 Tax=Azospirillum sp. BE72 TaxID=2817776 RepID=UPI00286D56EE|nr:hypothetical protein [Azospirillum sp. BE72]
MFTVRPSEIEHFDGAELVELLRVLLYAEARKAGVPLRNVDVPLQITIADGGQDASVHWENGEASTAYFPGRDIVFQCKATDHGDSQWKKEVWSKQSQPKKVKAKVLNQAISDVLARGGTYIGVTATPLVGTKAEDRATAIRDGIAEAGGDPTKLASVQVYDGNKLSAWATDHPAVALWVKERKAGIPLAAFSTLDRWGKRADIATPPFVPSPERKFSLGSSANDLLDFDQLAGRIVDHLSDPGACVRIWGASGIGKTRALHQALSSSTLRDQVAAQFIFCDHREVTGHIWDVANHLKNAPYAAVLVVDACPWEDSRRLFELANAADSQLRVITLGAEGRDQVDGCLMIRVHPSDRATIKGILASGLKTTPPDVLDQIAALCDGFPRLAVLAASAGDKGFGVRSSAHDVAEKILKAAGIEHNTIRALECLSLFEYLAPDREPSDFDTLSETLVHMKGELMYEQLVIAAEQHLVDRNHDSMAAQPLPIANYLALRRLRYLRPSTVSAFLTNTSSACRDSMLARWRSLGERSPTLVEVVRSHVLGGPLQEVEALLGEKGAPYLVAFVHADPNTMMGVLHSAIIRKSIDELALLDISDALLASLRLLASRKQTFRPTTGLVLRLAAASDLDADTPVLQLLRRLFQVALAGTEADDRCRRETLDEALEDNDPRMKRACVEALGAMLTTHMTRFGDFEQVGTEPYRSEWLPQDHEVVVSYFSWALERLLEVWRTVLSLRSRIEEIIAADLRTLLGFELLPIITTFVKEVVAVRGHWSEGTRHIGDWLYFDSPSRPDGFTKSVRALYDTALPSQPVEQALFYSRFWGTDIQDPDQRYTDNVNDLDFDYATRRAQGLAPAIASDPVQLARIIEVMASEELNAPFAFAQALAEHLPDPLGAFGKAVDVLEASDSRAGVGFVRALLSSLDRRLAGDIEQLNKLVDIAKSSRVLSESPMNIYSALRMTDERVKSIADEVRAKTLDPFRVVPISYGRALDAVSMPTLTALIEALVDRSDGGAWAAIKILSMVTHGGKDLPPEIPALIKLAILAPAIADGGKGNTGHAEHALERLIRRLAASDAIDDTFARGFAQQIERACRSVGGHYNRPADALRTGLTLIVKHAPLGAWAVLAGFYEVATRSERDRLEMIIAATKPFAFDVIRTGSGVLFETPQASMLEWVQQDPEGRIAFLLSFYPILEQVDDAWTWHPALQELADLYGRLAQFRNALRSRMLPSSYGGSLEEHLRSFQVPLASWAKHPQLGNWSGRMLSDIDSWLEHEAAWH